METKNTLTDELKKSTKALSKSDFDKEKINTHHESLIEDLKLNKKELKVANQSSIASEKMVAKLEGKLEVYKSFEIGKVEKNNNELVIHRKFCFKEF